MPIHRLGSVARKERKRILEQLYPNYCFWCNRAFKYENLTIDHIKPLSLNGSNDIANLRLACLSCNQSRGNAFDSTWEPFILARTQELLLTRNDGHHRSHCKHLKPHFNFWVVFASVLHHTGYIRFICRNLYNLSCSLVIYIWWTHELEAFLLYFSMRRWSDCPLNLQ
jgi:hypothetical protein